MTSIMILLISMTNKTDIPPPIQKIFSEYDLYPVLIEYLSKELNLFQPEELMKHNYRVIVVKMVINGYTLILLRCNPLIKNGMN